MALSTENLRLALHNAFSDPFPMTRASRNARRIADLTDIARAAAALSPEEVKATLIKAAQQQHRAIRRESA